MILALPSRRHASGRPARPRAARPSVVVPTLLAAVAAFAAGCGGSDPAPSDDADAAVADANPSDANPSDGAASDGAASRSGTPGAGGIAPFTDPAGRKWLNKSIPYDAFATMPGGGGETVAAADSPRGGARDLLAGIGAGTPARSSSGGGATGGSSRGTLPAAGMGSSMGGGAVPEESPGEDASGWGAVISAEDLRDEIKRSRNAMAAAVGTVAAFNRTQAELPGEAATLAAMAQITAGHPGRVPWKENADAVRTLAVRVGEAAGSRGRSARDEARASFDPLDSILGGNPPPDGAVAEFDRQLDAPRGELMNRMEAALKYLQQEAPDAAVMAERAGDLGRQAAVLAALSRFTADAAYDSAAEPDYQQWANELTAASNDALRHARETKDYDAYRAAVARAAQTCSACHGAYRF